MIKTERWKHIKNFLSIDAINRINNKEFHLLNIYNNNNKYSRNHNKTISLNYNKTYNKNKKYNLSDLSNNTYRTINCNKDNNQNYFHLTYRNYKKNKSKINFCNSSTIKKNKNLLNLTDIKPKPIKLEYISRNNYFLQNNMNTNSINLSTTNASNTSPSNKLKFKTLNTFNISNINNFSKNNLNNGDNNLINKNNFNIISPKKIDNKLILLSHKKTFSFKNQTTFKNDDNDSDYYEKENNKNIILSNEKFNYSEIKKKLKKHEKNKLNHLKIRLNKMYKILKELNSVDYKPLNNNDKNLINYDNIIKVIQMKNLINLKDNEIENDGLGKLSKKNDFEDLNKFKIIKRFEKNQNEKFLKTEFKSQTIKKFVSKNGLYM